MKKKILNFKFKENVLREILMFGDVWQRNWNYYSWFWLRLCYNIACPKNTGKSNYGGAKMFNLDISVVRSNNGNAVIKSELYEFHI